TVKAFAGLDAHPIKIHAGKVGSAAAFGPDGRAVVGGWRTFQDEARPGLLIDTNGALTELPVTGSGPVSWPVDDAPLQFTTASNVCRLHEMMTGKVRRSFSLAPGEVVADNDCPVLAMSADGKYVAAATAQTDSSTRNKVEHGDRALVWNTATGETLGALSTNVTALSFSPDGTLFVVGR